MTDVYCARRHTTCLHLPSSNEGLELGMITSLNSKNMTSGYLSAQLAGKSLLLMQNLGYRDK